MKRIDDSTVELTDAEQVVKDVHDRLLDRGYGMREATTFLTGADLPIRSEAPYLEAVLTPQFVEYLNT